MGDQLAKGNLDGILRELMCPLCSKFMKSPIFMCEYGHNVCGNCRKRFECCPIGDAKFLDARNLALENLSNTVQVPCMNRDWGCNFKFVAAVMEEHEKDCEFSLFKCPVVNNAACLWKGVLKDLKIHIKKCHPENLSEGNKSIKWYGRFGDRNEDYTGFIFAFGEIFMWNVGRTDSYVSLLHGFVKHIGLKKQTHKFRYNLAFSKLGDVEKMMVCHKVHSFDKSKEEILSMRQCLKVEYSTIKLFIDDSNKYTCLEVEVAEIL